MESPMIVLLFLSCFVTSVMMQLTPNVDKLLDWCIDSKHHKSEPGPEGALYGQCTPWKKRSCCQSNTTEQLHLDSLYNFEFNHCPHKASLSAACKRHFVQDHCFYECSPNVGPWTVKEARSWRKERYYKVPLCASDCAAWFDACKDDFTCTDNWSKNFEWIQSKDCPQGGPCKKNICPSGSLCKTFLEIYRTPGNFCEKVWDDAWKYTADDEPCMRIWFDGESGNPNEHVAAWKANLISAGKRLEACSLAVLTGFAAFGLLRNIL